MGERKLNTEDTEIHRDTKKIEIFLSALCRICVLCVRILLRDDSQTIDDQVCSQRKNPTAPPINKRAARTSASGYRRRRNKRDAGGNDANPPDGREHPTRIVQMAERWFLTRRLREKNLSLSLSTSDIVACVKLDNDRFLILAERAAQSIGDFADGRISFNRIQNRRHQIFGACGRDVRFLQAPPPPLRCHAARAAN